MDTCRSLNVLLFLFIACGQAGAFSPSGPRGRCLLGNPALSGVHRRSRFCHHAFAGAGSPPTATTVEASQLAKQLRRDGVVVLPEELKLKVGEVRAACHARFEKLLQAVEGIGCDPLEQEYAFSDICHRARYRWDIPMADDPSWKDFCLQALEAATPILKEMFEGKPMHIERSGVVISRPGAPAQGFHSDGENELFNIFVPLVDVEADGDGTEFWIGSHKLEMEKAMSIFNSGSVDFKTEMVAPSVEAGGLLLFHYRSIHRGLASLGRERAIAYLSISAQSKTSDTHNFPRKSVFNATDLDCARIPYWNDGRYCALDWDALTSRQQLIAASTANQLLINALRLSSNPSSELQCNSGDKEEIEHANKTAEDMIRKCCEDNELDWMLPRSRYAVAAALQRSFFSYDGDDMSETIA